MSKKNADKPDAVEDFLARQDYTGNPGKYVGNYRNRSPLVMLGSNWLFLIILGLMFGVGALLGLLMNQDLSWVDYLLDIPLLAFSALLILSGIRKALKNPKIRQ